MQSDKTLPSAPLKKLEKEWIVKQFDYRERAHCVDHGSKKILGGIEHTYDDFWAAWLTQDGAPHLQLGEYTEKDAAIRAVQNRLAQRKPSGK